MKIEKLFNSVLEIALALAMCGIVFLMGFYMLKPTETVALEAVKTEPIPIEEIAPVEEETVSEMDKEFAEISKITDKKEYLIQYKAFIEKYSHEFDYGNPETVYDWFSDEDIRLMQKVIETECYQGDFESKVNVANVILNRYFDYRWDENISKIITSDNQFAYGRNNITEDTVLALEYAFMIEDTTDGCLFFHSNPKTNTFNGCTYQFTDNVGHHFYK